MKTAIYAGSFDPITCGHLSVVAAAATAFDRMVVLIAQHPTKKPLFSLVERLGFVKANTCHLGNVACDCTSGLVVEYAKKHGAGFLVRGLRDETDAAYEGQLANINKTLAPEISTFFIPAEKGLASVSSSQLKHMASQGEDGSPYCSKTVWTQLCRRLRTEESNLQQEARHGL